jgi:hypothetical protein
MDTRRVCEALRLFGYSINQAAAEAGVTQSSLSRFCSRSQGMQLDAFEKVCDLVGMELVLKYSEAEFTKLARGQWRDMKTEYPDFDGYYKQLRQEFESYEWVIIVRD